MTRRAHTGIVAVSRETLRGQAWNQDCWRRDLLDLFILVFASRWRRIDQVSSGDYEVFIVRADTMGMARPRTPTTRRDLTARASLLHDVLPTRAGRQGASFPVGGIFRALAIGGSLMVLSVAFVA